jgi:putative endonuclease
MASPSRTLYIGVTNNLERRVYEHQHKLNEGFTKRYNITRLVWFESTPNVEAAITREKQLKGWLRARKIALINEMNPDWRDLSEEWRSKVPVGILHYVQNDTCDFLRDMSS